MPLQGSLDNRYEVGKSLGRGGMAEVYLARDRVLERDVALKILSRCYAEDGEFVRRFRREARSAASLTHPNVVSIHDLGEVEGEDGEPPTYYIAMEYVEGISLRELLDQEVRLPYETAAAIARQVAEGLAAAHERGIVHRDIKPHNILLSGSEGGEYPGEGRGGVKVADFGIARAAASSAATKTEAIPGTAHYLAPEQAMGGEATAQSDLYSLGVVLYEMLTGRRPYDAESPFGVAMSHITGDLRPPKRILPDLPGELNSIVVRLLGKDPEERHRDAEELLADLDALPQSSEPREAAPSGKWGQRSAGVLVPICLILLTASLWGVQQGPGLSSVTGDGSGELRGEVERILGGHDGDDASDGGGEPLRSGSDDEDSGEPTSQERARDGEQKEDGAAGGKTGEDEAAEDKPAQDKPSEDDPSDPSDSDSAEGGSSDSSDNGSPGSGSGGSSAGDDASDDASDDSPPEHTSEDPPEESGGARPGGSSGGQPGEQSGGGDSGTDGGEEQFAYVPDLAGQNVEAARSTLRSTGFEIVGITEQPGQGAEGTVLHTDPAAGSAREPGTGVTLIVSSGAGAEPPAPGGGDGEDGPDSGVPGDGGSGEEDMVSVPDVTERQSEQAVLILESAGLKADVRGAFTDEDSGTVASTDPSAGSTVEEGTVVTLTVTDGPQAASAPADEDPPGEQYQYED